MTLPGSPRDALHRFLDARTEMLTRLDAQLRACESPLDVAWTLADFAGRQLDLEDCVVYLVDADGRAVSQYAAWGPKRVAERVFENRIRLPLGEGIVGACALTQAPQVVPDTRLDPRYVLDDAMRLSELAVPIRDGARLRGVIDTEHAEPDHYHSGHIRALLAIAERGALRLAAVTATP
jgi:GAF domain-containing protein